MDGIPSSIELRHLRYFLAAAERGSLRKAAAVIGVHESAVSRRIRDLEDEIGASLFVRHTGGVTLTLAGQRFLASTRRALRQIGNGARSVGAIGRGESGRIRIGIFSSLASGFLADLIHAYGAHHGSVCLDFVDGHPSEHLTAIRQNLLDVAFLTGMGDHADCASEHLWSERIFAVLPADHPLSANDEMELGDLSREKFIVSEAPPGEEIQDYLVKRLADLGHHPDIEQQAVGRDNLMQLVALGRGLTLTSEATTATRFPGIVYRPVVGEILPFSAVWSSRNDNPACRRLLSLARSLSKSKGQSGSRSSRAGPPACAAFSQAME